MQLQQVRLKEFQSSRVFVNSSFLKLTSHQCFFPAGVRWGEEAAEGADELVLRGLADALVVDPLDAVKGPAARGIQGHQAKLMENDGFVLIFKMVFLHAGLRSEVRYGATGGCSINTVLPGRTQQSPSRKTSLEASLLGKTIVLP